MRTAITYLKKFIKAILVFLLDSTILIVPRRNKIRSKKLVLIIRLDAIGDFILWQDAAKELRKLYPDGTHRIILMANSVSVPIAESLPYFDEVWPIDRQRFYKQLIYRWQQLTKIRRASFDIAVQPTFSREFYLGDSAIRISGARERIGSVGDFVNIKPWQKMISDRWYTCLVPAIKDQLMELERNAEFLRGLGLPAFKASLPTLEYQDNAFTDDGNYFVVFPGAMAKYRQWSIDRFRTLASKLHKATGWHVIVCGGPGEEPLSEELALGADFPLVDRVGTTTLPELASIIRNARLLITNETSAVHIAAAVSTYVVCILGGGHFGRFMPYIIETETNRPLPAAVFSQMDCFHCNWKCIYKVPSGKPMPCIEEVTVEDVWKTIEPLIG